VGLALNSCITLLSAFILLTVVLTPANADEKNAGVFSISSKPYGKTYGEWSFEWWQWFSSIPAGVNPGEDTTGRYCTSNQNNTNIWFLTLTFGFDKATRTCTIPAQKAIFVPVLSSLCDRGEYPELKTEQDLLKCAQQFNEGIQRELSLEVDGKQITSLESYRASSPLTNITYPEHNVFGGTAGSFESVADGFYVILEPLPLGEHVVHIKALLVNSPKGSPAAEGSGYSHDVTYRLLVK
jgi:hypothetical protein